MHEFDMNNWTTHGMGWIFWIIIIGLLVWLTFYLTSRNTKKTANESPLDILKKRYVNGEISKEEYVEKKKAIEQENTYS